MRAPDHLRRAAARLEQQLRVPDDPQGPARANHVRTHYGWQRERNSTPRSRPPASARSRVERAAVLLDDGAAQAQAQAHAFALVVKNGVNSCCSASRRSPGPSRCTGTRASALAPGARASVSTRVGPRAAARPSPAWRCARGSAAPARPSCGRTAPRGRPGVDPSSTRTPSLRACRLTSGSTASTSASRRDRLARLLAPAHEVVHALDHRPARSACSAMRCIATAAARSVSPSAAAGACDSSRLSEPVA